MRPTRPLLVLALALALLAPAVSAYDETEASSLRGDVLFVWHEPDVPDPHTQWRGYLQLHPSSNVTEAHYQVCRVGQACFAPPTFAEEVGNGTFAFDTADYLANGRPVDYQPGWRLGVKWFLDGEEFPKGPDLASAECQGDAAAECAERHYFVFTMGGEEAKPAPGPGAAPLLLALLALLGLARRRRA